jgi:hypothetical protein
MTAHPYHRKLAKALDRMGGLYLPQDILAAIAEGRMQSFVEGDSWAITQVTKYPRATVLEVLIALGDLKDCRILHDRILKYAEEIGVGLINTFGRRGWIPDAKERGWKVKMTGYVYQREL